MSTDQTDAEQAGDRPSRAGTDSLERVVLVTGKGGVGKTTVAAGLATLYAREPGGAIYIDFGDSASGRRALERGDTPAETMTIEHITVDARRAIVDATTELFGSAMVAKLVTGNFAVKRLLGAAPALRELAQLHAVHDISRRFPRARLVVDLPATGHGVAWLRVPRQIQRLLGAGPLHRLAGRIADELLAAEQCSVLVVGLPERLVLGETAELCQAMREEVGIPSARLVVNRMPEPLADEVMDHARELRQGSQPPLGAEALHSLLESRDASHREALAAIDDLNLGTEPLFLPDAGHDPTADEVARWLGAELARPSAATAQVGARTRSHNPPPPAPPAVLGSVPPLLGSE